MSEINQPSSSPQFGTAEYSQDQKDTCRVCKQYVSGTYYRVNGAMLCGSCADRLRREAPQDSHAAFVRALLFGLGGFAAGLVLYAGFVILTGISLGYVALAVGWIVGKAMMLGSGGIGGRRYQIAAVLLTYAAVSIAFVPIVIYYQSKQTAGDTRVQQQSNQAGSDTKSGQSQNSGSEDSQRPSLAGYIGYLALWGLASPFLRLASGPFAFIGLIILFVGMQFAWKMTAVSGL